MIALARPGTGGSIQNRAPPYRSASGLSSSAALSVALAEVFGVGGSPRSRRPGSAGTPSTVSGVPVGAMDPLVCAGGRRGHALLIDFATLATDQVPVPDEAEIVVVDSGQRRTLRTSGLRRPGGRVPGAASVVGPLGIGVESDLAALSDPVLHRHGPATSSPSAAGSESSRRRWRPATWPGRARLMAESHRSLAE